MTIIRSGIRQNLMTCTDPEAAAWRILSMLEGLAAQAVAHRVIIDRDQVIGWSVAHAEFELGLPAGAIA